MEIAIRLTLPQVESLMTSLEAYHALLFYLSRESKPEDWIKIENSTHSWAPIIPTSHIKQKRFIKASEDVLNTFSKYPSIIPLVVLCTELFDDVYRNKTGYEFVDPFQRNWIQQIGSIMQLFEDVGFDTDKYLYDPKKNQDFKSIFEKLSNAFLWKEFDNVKMCANEYCGGSFDLVDEPWCFDYIDLEDPSESIYVMKASVSITEDELQASSSALNMLLHLWQGEWGGFEQFYQNMYTKEDFKSGRILSKKDSLLYEYRRIFGNQYVFEEIRNDILRVFDALALKQFNMFFHVNGKHFMRKAIDVKMIFDVLMHQRYDWYSIDQKDNIDYPRIEFSQEYVGRFDGDVSKWLNLLNEIVLNKNQRFAVVNDDGLLCVPVESETYQKGYKALARGDILCRKKNGFFAVYQMIPPLGKFL